MKVAIKATNRVINSIVGMNIRWGWVIILTLAMQIAFFKAWPLQDMVALKKVVLIFSYILLLATISRNLHLWSMRLVAVATVMNFLPIVINGGLMPISSQAITAAGLENVLGGHMVGDLLPHTRAQLLPLDQTRLWFLTDIIPITTIRVVLSPGDILVLCGLAVFLIEVIRQGKQAPHGLAAN